MIIILSPSKTISKIKVKSSPKASEPTFLESSKKLVGVLRKFSQTDLQKLMALSPSLATLTVERFISWNTPFDEGNSYPAILSFKGDVYEGIAVEDFSTDDLSFAQSHLRILSGLYGALRPLDLIQPYRLEMATKISVGKSKNLYDFWKLKLTEYIKCQLDEEKSKVLVNLASAEYSKAIDLKALNVSVITPVFKEQKVNTYKTIAIHAKRARGLMTRYIIKNKIEDFHGIKLFNEEGYFFNPELTKGNDWVFVR
jgi:hypothetical protein